MKIPLLWLHELVEFDASPEELADRLTFSGLEVESVDASGADLRDIVAAEILTVRPHPNAPRLRLCDVTDGARRIQVVCGADNFSEGDKVPLALPGAVLMDGTRIKPVVLRGKESHGMLCAPDELGISDDHGGLMLLPRDTPVGTPMAQIAGPPDHVLTVEVTPNRPDCMSMIGIAREVAALYNSRLTPPPVVTLPEIPLEDVEEFEVRVENELDCPRYIAWRLADAVVRPSPWWLQRRLFQSGVRPISNLVDITNYVMLESGQPLHAFDRNLIQGGKIIVRRARADEKLITLDEIERLLNPEILTIADADRPVALAGIMGGAGSGITSKTSMVVLESACFNNSLIRRTGRVLGLLTESAARFERGVDVYTTEWAARRAVDMMTQLTGAKIVAPPIDVFPVEPQERKIECRFDRVRRLLGLDVADSQITAIFEALEIKVPARARKSCTVCVPSFRSDLEGEADLAEEVARIYGLDRLPLPPPRRNQAESTTTHLRALAAFRMRDLLLGLGLTEIMNYSFVSRRLLDLFGTDDAAGRVAIPNPVSQDHGFLRNSLLPQMVATCGANRAVQVQNAAFFEAGRVFQAAKSGDIAERDVVALGLMGAAGRMPLDQSRPVDDTESFLWLKGVLENLAREFRFELAGCFAGSTQSDGLQIVPTEDAPGDYCWPGRAAFAAGRGFVIMLDGITVGRAGLIRPELRMEWRINEPLAAAEFLIDPWLARLEQVKSPLPPPVYPAVQRDLAFQVPDAMTHTRIMDAVREIAPRDLTDAVLFDIFKGKQIGAGYKSMAYTLTYRSRVGTLTDEAVNDMHAKLVQGVRNKLQVEIRAG